MNHQELLLLSEEARQSYLAQLCIDDRLALLRACSESLQSQMAELDEKMWEEQERLLPSDEPSRVLAGELLARLTSRRPAE